MHLNRFVQYLKLCLTREAPICYLSFSDVRATERTPKTGRKWFVNAITRIGRSSYPVAHLLLHLDTFQETPTRFRRVSAHHVPVFMGL